MTILGVEFETSNLVGLKTFYSEYLGLPLEDDFDALFAVKIGPTKVVFSVPSPDLGSPSPAYSFTIAVAPARFDALMHEISEVAALLPHKDKLVTQSPNSGTRAFYLYDPAGNLIEFASSKDAAPEDVTYLGVTYVGLPVADVFAAQTFLRQQPTVANVTQWPLVLVKPGTHWFPGTAVAGINYTMITLAGAINAVTKVLDYPYYIHTARIS